MEQKNINTNKFKKGTTSFSVFTTICAGGSMFGASQIFGTDGAIITGILLLILMASAIRYNI